MEDGRWVTLKDGRRVKINDYMNDKIKGTYTIKKKKDRQFPKYRTMTFYNGKEKAGYLEYQDNNGNITVNVIETEPKYRRQGIATRLLKELKDEHGDIVYKFSAVLSDGDKLLKNKTNIIKKEDGDYYVKIK